MYLQTYPKIETETNKYMQTQGQADPLPTHIAKMAMSVGSADTATSHLQPARGMMM